MSSKRYFLLGLLFLAVFGLLGYFTLFKTDLKLFGHRQELSVYFSRANGLREGDAVLVAGVRWGRVAEITFDPDADESHRIVVTASLDDPLVLREGSVIRIEESTLLGGRNLTIDPGPAGAAPIAPDRVIEGSVSPNPIQALGELVRDNEVAVTETIQGVRNLVDGLQTGRGALGRMFADEALAEDLSSGLRSASRTFENVERITATLAEGRGTLGMLLERDEIYTELTSIAANLDALLTDVRAIAGDAREGRGLVGRLLTDEGLSSDVADGISELREMIGAIHSGEGTIGMLVRDDGIAKNIDSLVKRVAQGEGLLGKLFSDEELYGDVRSFSENLAAITAHVRAGRGTVGRVMMEEDLYDQIKSAVGLITRSLEEYREAAPISTMTSVIFGAF